MEKEVDIEEIKTTLKDADMYEVNLSNDELRSIYAALKNSENTANEEELSRNLSKNFDTETPEVVENSDGEDSPPKLVPLRMGKKTFTPKVWSTIKKTNVTQNKLKNQNSEGPTELSPVEKPKDATKIIFGFNEMLENLVERTHFNIVNHDYKFIPIQCTQTFLNADIKTKAKILYSYHSKMLDIRDKVARQTLYPAPIPKPIVIADKFPSSSENSDYSETYVSRKGRQTKRKIYYCENSLDDDFVSNSKKAKNADEDWLGKIDSKKYCTKNKTSVKESGHNNEISEISETVLEDKSEFEDKMNVTTVHDDKTVTESEDIRVDPKNRSTPKSQISKKLNNSEIMQRSKLFRDTSKRADMLFDQLVEDNEKKQREEKIREDFEKTLEQLDNDGDYDKNEISDNDLEEIVDVEAEEPKRRRVIPPIPGRKPIGRRGNVQKELTPLTVVIQNISPKSKGKVQPSQGGEEPAVSNPKKRTNIGRKPSGGTEKKNPASTSQNDTQECPICNQTFHKDKIQNHAATCGDEPETVTRSSMKLSKLSCHVCDRVIPVTTEYEVHVKDCIKRKQLETTK